MTKEGDDSHKIKSGGQREMDNVLSDEALDQLFREDTSRATSSAIWDTATPRSSTRAARA
jgi:hypothetical protein